MAAKKEKPVDPKTLKASGRVNWEKIIYDEAKNARRRPVSETRVRDMAQSILDNGQEQPSVVREAPDGENYILHIGATRYKAVRLINVESMTGKYRPTTEEPFKLAVVIRDVNSEEAFAHSIVENRDRQSTTIVDDAHNVRILREGFGWDDERIADHYRIKKEDRPKWITDLGKISRLPANRQDEIEEGILKVSTGLVLADLPEDVHEEILQVAEEIHAERRGEGEEEPVASLLESDEWDLVDEGATSGVLLALKPILVSVAGVGEVVGVDSASVEAPAAGDEVRPKTAKKAASKKKAAEPATKKRAATKRDVLEAAKRKGHLKDKVVSRTMAGCREFWKPIADDGKKKALKIGKLAALEMAFYAGGDPDDYYSGVIALLK